MEKTFNYPKFLFVQKGKLVGEYQNSIESFNDLDLVVRKLLNGEKDLHKMRLFAEKSPGEAAELCSNEDFKKIVLPMIRSDMSQIFINIESEKLTISSISNFSKSGLAESNFCVVDAKESTSLNFPSVPYVSAENLLSGYLDKATEKMKESFKKILCEQENVHRKELENLKRKYEAEKLKISTSASATSCLNELVYKNFFSKVRLPVKCSVCPTEKAGHKCLICKEFFICNMCEYNQRHSQHPKMSLSMLEAFPDSTVESQLEKKKIKVRLHTQEKTQIKIEPEQTIRIRVKIENLSDVPIPPDSMVVSAKNSRYCKINNSLVDTELLPGESTVMSLELRSPDEEVTDAFEVMMICRDFTVPEQNPLGFSVEVDRFLIFDGAPKIKSKLTNFEKENLKKMLTVGLIQSEIKDIEEAFEKTNFNMDKAYSIIFK